MDDRMDLKSFLRIMRRRAFTILITAVLVSVLTALITLFVIKPTYEATEYIMIGKQGNKDAYTESQEFSRTLASSIDVMKSPIVLNSVRGELNLQQEDLKSLQDKIALQNNKDSQIINIVVKDTDPQYAKRLAHTVASTSVNKINGLLKIKEVQLLSSSEDEVAVKRIGSPLLNIAIGLFVGLFLGLGLAMLREYFDDSVNSAKEVELELGLAVLGQVRLKEKRTFFRRKGRTTVAHHKKGGEVNA